MGVMPLCYYLIERLKKWTNGHTGKIVENSVLFYYYLVSTKVHTGTKKISSPLVDRAQNNCAFSLFFANEKSVPSVPWFSSTF